jgi:hypothetical protein
LGGVAAVLAGVEARAVIVQPGDSRRLASGRFQTVLDMALFFVDDIELSFF